MRLPVSYSGRTQWSAQTTAYGRVRVEQGTRAECPFRFQGQYEDTETGLYYNRFRYYDPQEGRYVSQDPIKLESGQPNFYAYVKDTNTWIDKLGLACSKLADSAQVVRGGTNKAEQFTNGSGVTTDINNKLKGVSVNSVNDLSVTELANGIPNGQIGTTTVGKVRELEGDVISSPTKNNPNHATLSGITAGQAEGLFNPTIPNPAKRN